MYVVILAGGGGTRLHPLSRPDCPKPFLPLVGEETLLQRTARRLAPLVDERDVHVVADRRYGGLVARQLPEARLVPEPSARNTAAAVALATVAIDRPEDEVMLVLPADHFIDPEREAAFVDVVRVAVERLATGSFGLPDPLVAIGVEPRHPSTEFGYLRPDTERREEIDGIVAYPLLAFEEKPTAARARELLQIPGIAWNAGMFAWRRRAIRAALETFTPLLTLLDGARGSDLALAGAYDAVTPVSVDRAVMEGAARDRRVVMGAMEIGWSDLGTWSALLQAIDVLGGGDAAGLSGRVVTAGESFETAAGDLVVRSRDGGLVLEEPGTATIAAETETAHLVGAARIRADVEALLDRVRRAGDRP